MSNFRGKISGINYFLKCILRKDSSFQSPRGKIYGLIHRESNNFRDKNGDKREINKKMLRAALER